jgi:hypothetical protein
MSAAIDFSALLTVITICKSSLRDRASNLHDAFLEEAKKCTPDSDNEVDFLRTLIMSSQFKFSLIWPKEKCFWPSKEN